MSIDHGNVYRPREDHNSEALFILSWNAWALTRKRSKQNLLGDVGEIDPIVQNHMTISSAACEILKRKKEAVHVHHRRLQYKHESCERSSIITTCDQTKSQVQHDLNRLMKQRCIPNPSSYQFCRVAKHRRLNYDSSRNLSSLGNESCNDCESDNHYNFWRKLNALAGKVNVNALDPRR